MRESEKNRGLTRRQLVERGAATGSALLLAQGAGLGIERALGAARAGSGDLAGMNVILFLTDQERKIQHFPKGWAEHNLPGLQRLKRHGLNFENAFTNACMCSPARSTLMTGFFPAQHGVKYTLEEDMPADQYPQVEMPTDFANPATVTAAAGYTPVYKGKWHCSKPAGQYFRPSDLRTYGFGRWDPPDGGANQDLNQAGGGFVDHDGRYIDATGNPVTGKEGALQYLSSAAARQQPFFMVISLVNPHDVLFYPKKYKQAGYDDSWVDGQIGLPATIDEDLATKPSVQKQFLRIFNLTGKPRNRKQQREYLNFYGNLMRSSDNYLVKVLDKLEQTGLLGDTLIVRTADHGEMGLAHGGLRQKNFNFYEESLRVPLIYSNPRLYPRPCHSKALVSHVDFLPTLANLVGAPDGARADWEGRDYSSLVMNPGGKPVQDYTVFTYDDYQSGQASGPYPQPPNHVVSIREHRWKLAKYYDTNGQKPPQWEMYDLKNDPLEKRNIAYPGHRRTPHQEREYRRLKRRLARVQKNRLQPLAPTASTSGGAA